jgi:hypothetical protein
MRWDESDATPSVQDEHKKGKLFVTEHTPLRTPSKERKIKAQKK